MKSILSKLTVAVLLGVTILGGQVALAKKDFLDANQAFEPELNIAGEVIQINWQIAEGYFLYRHGFELAARRTGVSKVLPLRFDVPTGEVKYDPFFEKQVETYKHSVLMTSSIEGLDGQSVELVITAQGCADEGLCFAPTTFHFLLSVNGWIGPSQTPFQLEESAIRVPAASPKLGNQSSNSPALEASEVSPPADTAEVGGRTDPISFKQWVVLALAAMLGGFILNMMPCVFPVLSLKVLSFSREPELAFELRKQGWAYTFGVVLSFILAASLILIAQSAGKSLGWGFQLQQPVFVTLMIYLFFIMALSLSGAFEFGGSVMGLGQNLTIGHGLKSSFFTGVLAALVASPCTAPFMATASGVALTQSVPVALSIFAALGLGMALPFLAMSYSPRLSRWLPRPGAWMLYFKQALAFPLYLTALWLLWVLSHQSDSEMLVKVLFGALMIVGALWLLSLRIERKGLLLLRNVAALALLAPALLIAVRSNGPETPAVVSVATENVEVFSTQRLAYYRELGKPVFIDLTADWCLTCKVNESVALTDDIRQELNSRGIVLMIGDWTNENEEIAALLKRYQRSGIPLYLMYPQGGGEPEILPQLLTKGIMKTAMDRALI